MTDLKSRDAVSVPAPPRSPIRPEIQALRAFAVLIVVLNHLWPERLGGGFIGVDVFFVISGFLITGHLVRELTSTGRISLSRFWARRIRRLLPASLLVLLAVVAGTVAFVPATEWPSIMDQVRASALYVQNWALIGQATDYFTSSDSPSPITHYWSLSAEEQFYLVWPVLILAAAWIAVRARRPSIVGVTVALGVVAAASLVYSIVFTATNPSSAYFSTFTRAWEFGFGGLVAITASRLRLGPRAAAVCGWVGWVLLALGLVVITESSPFPGATALLPVVGAALVIAGGAPAVRGSATRLVSLRPVQFLGNISYGVYLWHWPLVIIVPFVLGYPLPWTWKLVILAATIVLAWVTKVLVEDPARTLALLVRGRPWRSYVAGLAAMAIVLASTVAVSVAYDQRRADAATPVASADPCLGASALDPANEVDCPRPFELSDPDSLLALSAQDYSVDNGSMCQQEPTESAVLTCSFGVPEGEQSTTIALVGDSHAGHYSTVLNRLALANGWRINVYLRSSCPAALGDDIAPNWDPAIGASCRDWEREVVPLIAGDPDVDLVFTSSISREYGRHDATGALIDTDISGYYEAAWNEWIAAGKKVFVAGDVPHMDLGDIPTCLAAATGYDPCTRETDFAIAEDPMQTAVADLASADVGFFNPNPFICTAELCHSVVGGIAVFADGNHLTAEFARSLQPYLYTEMMAAGSIR